MQGIQEATVKIIDNKIVAEDTYEITFECDLVMNDFNAGQHIEVFLPKLLHPDNNGNKRNFSIVSSPNEKGRIAIVFRGSSSGFKRTLIELPIGSEVIIRGPLGLFGLPKETKQSVVLIAGGVGISPFMSMLRYATEEHLELPITLLFVNSRKERAMYMSELDVLASHNKNFNLYSKYGYLDVEFIKKSVGELEGKTWYVAGPPIMIQNVIYLLHEIGILNKDIFIEEMSGYDDTKDINQQSTINQENKDIESLLQKGDLFIKNPVFKVLSQSALVVITNIQGEIIYANDLFVKMTGYSMDELIGKNPRIFKSNEHSPAFYKELWDTISSGKVWRGEIKNRTKDGSFYWTDSTISPIFNDKSEITHYLAVRFDIDKQKKAEAELIEKTRGLQRAVSDMKKNETDLENIKKAILNILSDLDEEKKAVEKKVIERTLDIEHEKNKLLQVTSNMKGGAILFDHEGKLVFVNQKLYAMLGVNQKDAEHSSVMEALLEYFDQLYLKESFKQCFEGMSFTVPEIESNGKIYEMSFLSLDKTEDNGEKNGYFFLMYDITDAKLLERSKSKLVAVASHQLRTPLTAMRGNVEMLIDESYGPLNSEQHELLGDIDISTTRLISMVNDMLDITKIERGDLDMKLELVNVREVIDSILSDFADYSKRHGVSIVVEVTEDAVVYGDSSRVRQVFQNLIDNAIKYSKNPGELTISSNVNGNFAQFVFKDKGVGIPEMEQSRIFGRFYRASNTANYSSSGSGLGLYIVKSIVSQLGGDIWFESEENVGTTFFFTLPIREIKPDSD